MTTHITREDIAEIYEQLGSIEMRKAQAEISETPKNAEPGILDRAFVFYETADQFREIDKMRPLRLNLYDTGAKYVRATENLW